MHDPLRELRSIAHELARGRDSANDSLVRFASIACFSSRKRLYIGSYLHTRPLIAAVLEGQKETSFGGRRTVAAEGDLWIVPAGVQCDVTSTPDPRTGRFRALAIDLDPEIGAMLARDHGTLCVSISLGAFDPGRPHVLRADAAALQAVVHFGRTLLIPNVHASLVRHRAIDLLLALSLQQGRARPAEDVVLAIRDLVRSEPEAAWSTDDIARKLAMSPATLRRRLSLEGLTLRALRTDERMALASALLAKQGMQVSEVALRCGYRSPSKFARQFRQWSGRAPSDRTTG